MKRQERAVPGRTGMLKTISTTTSTKKKGKTRVDKKKKEVVGKEIIEEKRENDRELAETLEGEEVMMVMDWDERPCLLCEVVEQMSWGTCWSPFWEKMDLMAEARHAFHSEVVWDDDIWELKDISDVSYPCESSGLVDKKVCTLI